jgi:hypothetical protein
VGNRSADVVALLPINRVRISRFVPPSPGLRFAVRIRCAEPPADGADEGVQIAETVGKDVGDHGEVDIVVAVHQHVPKTRHVAERLCEGALEPPVALEQVEELTIGARFAEPPVRHDVGGDVERGV